MHKDTIQWNMHVAITHIKQKIYIDYQQQEASSVPSWLQPPVFYLELTINLIFMTVIIWFFLILPPIYASMNNTVNFACFWTS